MTDYDIYVLLLCLIVFVLLTFLSIVVMVIIIKQLIKLINLGAEDDNIKKEYDKNRKRKKRCTICEKVITVIFYTVFIVFSALVVYVNVSQNFYHQNIPNVSVVRTASMQSKNPKNTYLFTNDLNNQIDTFDLIFFYEKPKQEELKLYDIVVYEVDDINLVHRIVKIEEPNEKHPGERWFMCQGDAVASPDRFPVEYSQIKGIYRGERVPFVGSFVLFMQSPAGWLCVFLVVFAMICVPVIEGKLAKIKRQRLQIIGYFDEIAVAKKENLFSKFNKTYQKRSFKELLRLSPKNVYERYGTIIELLNRIVGVRTIDGFKSQTYKKGNTPIVKFTVRGKTLNAYLGLNPSEYQNTKYVFTDVSTVKAYKNYPMRVKVTSDRQVRWTIELINAIAKANGFEINQKQTEFSTEFSFDKLKNKKKVSFVRKLKKLPIAKQRLETITEYVSTVKGVRTIQSFGGVTYKKGNTPIVKFTVRGKTLNAYLGLNPSEYQNTKYVFTDVSTVKAYKNYPMRVKVTSDRQVRWTIELLSAIASGVNS